MTNRSNVSIRTAQKVPDDVDISKNEFEDFIYLISHDVRNSVRALIELPQWISEDLEEAGVKVDGSVAESIDLMNKHTGRLDRMLVDLLTFSRVGRMQSIAEIDLGAALSDVIDEMNVPSGFEVVRAFDCRSLMLGERDVLTLLNALVSNAIKHHDRTTGKVIVTSHEDGTDILLTVRDNGPGIPHEFHAKIFGAMTTLRPRDDVEGSGMGLAISKKISQHYNGSIHVRRDKELRGTTIEVRLPKTH